MILLGYASMMMLGLLPLVAVARMLGTADEHVLLLPVPYALLTGLTIGTVTCLVVGQLLGLLAFESLHSYEGQRRTVAETGAARRRRRAGKGGRIRSTAAAPFVRFS